MKPSEFTSLGAFELKAGKPIEAAIFETIVEALGNGRGLSVEQGSFNDCFAFMAAKILGMAVRKLERGAEQVFAAKVYDLLQQHEVEHKITPDPTSSIPQRKRMLAAKKRSRQGSKPAALGEELRLLLGNEFVGLHVTTPSERSVWPSDLGDAPMLLAPPTMERKLATNILPISINLGSAHQLPYSPIEPNPSDQSGIFREGDIVLLEPEILGRCERLQVEATGTMSIDGDDYNTITVSPFNAREPLCTIASLPYPAWTSNQREIVVVVKPQVIQSQAKMAQINNLLEQVVTGVTTWSIVQESNVPFVAGPFTLDDPLLGMLDANPLDAATVNMVF